MDCVLNDGGSLTDGRLAQVKMVFSLGTTREPVRNTPTPVNERESYCLTDEQVMELADCAIKIEDHYSAINGHLSPMDIEWALGAQYFSFCSVHR